MSGGRLNLLTDSAPLEVKPTPTASTRKLLVIGLLGGVLFSIVGVVAVAYFFTRTNLKDTVGSGGTIPSGVDMVFIKGGGFTMGSDTAGVEQRGAHFQNVGSFYIGRTEVTNAEYAAFVKATGYPVPTDDSGATETYWKPWSATDPPIGRERWPVTNVSIKDAEAFAKWLSTRDSVVYRLPSEAEWEFAARNGSKGTLFPWGDWWDSSRANLNGTVSPVNVGSYPAGATQTGLMDMVGNVWEWTSSKASFYDGSQPKFPTANVWRGGSFADKLNVDFFNATDRGWYRNEDYKVSSIGFRLARSAQ
jgi:formylglycine-generating enzyme required for sulfatase activity